MYKSPATKEYWTVVYSCLDGAQNQSQADTQAGPEAHTYNLMRHGPG